MAAAALEFFGRIYGNGITTIDKTNTTTTNNNDNNRTTTSITNKNNIDNNLFILSKLST